MNTIYFDVAEIIDGRPYLQTLLCVLFKKLQPKMSLTKGCNEDGSFFCRLNY